MKRWLFNLAAAVSLLLAIIAAGAWALSYKRPQEWRLLATAHSADLKRVRLDGSAVVFMATVNQRTEARHGYWDGWWALSQSGTLMLLAQTVDYEGNVRRVSASPPSLIADLTGSARAQAVVFRRMPDSHPRARRLGFAWDTDVQHATSDVVGAPVTVKALMIMVPYWSIVLVSLALPMFWLRARQLFQKRS